MACHPHRENPRRRALNAINELFRHAGNPVRVTGARGGLRLGSNPRLTTRAVLDGLAADGFITLTEKNARPLRLDVALTAVGIQAVEDHEEAHRLADEKAREAAANSAGARAAVDADTAEVAGVNVIDTPAPTSTNATTA